MISFDLTRELGDLLAHDPSGARRFVPLGTAVRRRRARRSIRRRITWQSRTTVRDFWGTLGWDNDRRPDWRGRLRLSGEGNERSLPGESGEATSEEVELIAESIPESKEGRRIIERFIDLSDVEFRDLPDTWDENAWPRLRVTVWVKPNEGALAFLQYKGGSDDASANEPGFSPHSDQTELEYIQPRPTATDACNKRHELTFFVPVVKGVAEAARGNKFRLRQIAKAALGQLVIKVLTFRRRNGGGTGGVLRRVFRHIWGFEHSLVRWCPPADGFVPLTARELRPERDVRTLLLLHGTFSSCETAFRGLAEAGGNSWLNRHYGMREGRYPQIIGFNHPTLAEDAVENAQALENLLKGRLGGPVDLVTHSRGGLLGKHLAFYCPELNIERGALVACANGVAYFETARRVARFLSAMKVLARVSGKQVAASIAAAAQHSGERFLALPGSELMTPGSKSLKPLLEPAANARLSSVFLPIVGDYEASLSQRRGLFRRWAERGIDRVIRLSLGKQHDWVVGTERQFDVPKKCLPKHWQPPLTATSYKNPNFRLVARHGDYFFAQKTTAQETISEFLK